jgi:hypothetical protein
MLSTGANRTSKSRVPHSHRIQPTPGICGGFLHIFWRRRLIHDVMVLIMNESQNNLMDIVNRENQVLLATIDSNAEYYKVSFDIVDYLWKYVTGFDSEYGLTFTLFWGQFIKTITQTLLSVLRLHSVQGLMTLRYALESAALACYALFSTELESFCGVDEYDRAVPIEKALKKAYTWLENNDPKYSSHLKLRKTMINDYWAHCNILPTSQNLEIEGNEADTVYFDRTDKDMNDQYLLVVADIAFSFILASSQLNIKFKRFQVSNDFHHTMQSLQKDLTALREKSKENYRFSRWMNVPK